MAKSRSPGKLDATGVGVWVRDPDAAALSYFATYRRIPGVGSFTAADPESPTSESIGLDGAVSSAGFGSPGTLTVPISMKGQHPTHRLLGAKRRSKEPVTVAWRRPAAQVIRSLPLKATEGVVVATADLGKVTVSTADTPTAKVVRRRLGQLLKEGYLISLANDAAIATAAAQAGLLFLDYSATPVTGDPDKKKFRTIDTVEKDDDGMLVSFVVVPKLFAAVTAAAVSWVSVLSPGLQVADVEAQVTNFGDGDFQPGSVVTGNLVLAPAFDIPHVSAWISRPTLTRYRPNGSGIVSGQEGAGRSRLARRGSEPSRDRRVPRWQGGSAPVAGFGAYA